MGNILSLRRQGLHDDGTYDEIDNLKYTYDGNQVVRVEDTAIDPVYKDCFTFTDGADAETEYEYDENGNLTKDLNRGICCIGYNCLNLPSRVDFSDGSRITYIYDGGGRKLRTDHYINPLTASVPQLTGGTGTAGAGSLVHTWTDYCGNKVYENDTLCMSLFDGGYVSYDAKADGSSPSPSYHYYIKDHLGNNRLVLGESGGVEQVNHYYPFGGLMGERENLASSQRYKYNGKELDRTHGLDWYDYGARMYDPTLARWMVPDPLAEKYYSVSPYAYCGNRPINISDPDGKDWIEGPNGQAQFDPKWEKYSKLPEGYKYLGKSVVLMAENGDIYYGRNDGKELFWYTPGGKSADLTQETINVNSSDDSNTIDHKSIEKDSKSIDKAMNTASLVGVANDVKLGLFQIAANMKNGDSPFYRYADVSSLGATAARYYKFFNGMGFAGSAITGVYTGYQLKNNFDDKNWNAVARNGVDLFMTGIGFFGGPIGMGISCLYTVGTTIYDNYNR